MGSPITQVTYTITQQPNGYSKNLSIVTHITQMSKTKTWQSASKQQFKVLEIKLKELTEPETTTTTTTTTTTVRP
jgi:hypothetical protein